MPNTISFKSNYTVSKNRDIQYHSVKMSLSVLSQNGQENEQLPKAEDLFLLKMSMNIYEKKS